MDIRPILSTLRRHKTAATLIVLEIALSCAIICNAAFLISNRLDRMDRPSGLAESEIVRLQLSGIGRDDNAMALTAEDVAALRAIAGVKSVTITNQVPYGNSSWNSGVSLEPDQQNPTLSAAVYIGDEQLLETFGLHLVAGRDFNADEYINWEEINATDSQAQFPSIPSTIISRVTAERLFPAENPIGQVIYSWGENPIKVVGVVEHLIRPNENGGPSEAQLSIMLPVRVPFTIGRNYVLRTDPARRDEVLKAAVATLERVNPNRILLEQSTFAELRDDYYRQDRAMAWLLVAVCIALLVVTALGIVGLSSFWVQQRTKQIGVRRALGATRGQILRYFQTENFLLATVGIMLGMALAYGINLMLMDHYELARLPAYFLPIGAIILWVLGQIAVLNPALHAANTPPAVATRCG